jgi:anti-anti-sigma factor
MSVNKRISDDNSKVEISITGRFDFSLHQHFRDSYSNCNEKNVEFTLNLSETTYMDSSALGMILLLKDHAESCSGKVIISKPSDSVNKILEIAQFHRLLTIEL